jgi:hypothetical protein
VNDAQRSEIKRLREAGTGYTAIAQALSLSANTIKTYCRRNGLGGARAIKNSQDTVFDVTGTENICGRAGRFNLLSSGNRVINTTAEAPESLDLSGKSRASIIPEVTVIFAEHPDEQAVRDVLGMLMRERI